MKTDYEVRRLFSYMDKSKTLKALADRAEMYEQTARKYINREKKIILINEEENYNHFFRIITPMEVAYEG